MATIMVDDPRLEQWLLDVLEKACEVSLEAYGEKWNDTSTRLAIAVQLVKGKMTATWNEKTSQLNFSIPPSHR